MTAPSSLLALEGKLVEAKGPDAFLDREIENVLGDEFLILARHYTSSIDAALALVSRVKPHIAVELNTGDPTLKYGNPEARLLPHNGVDEAWDNWPSGGISAQAPTLALAICIALIRSLKGAGE